MSKNIKIRIKRKLFDMIKEKDILCDKKINKISKTY